MRSVSLEIIGARHVLSTDTSCRSTLQYDKETLLAKFCCLRHSCKNVKTGLEHLSQWTVAIACMVHLTAQKYRRERKVKRAVALQHLIEGIQKCDRRSRQEVRGIAGPDIQEICYLLLEPGSASAAIRFAILPERA